MDIRQFAQKYGVRLAKDSCKDEIIPSSMFLPGLPRRNEYCSHIYEHGGKTFGVCLIYPPNTKMWARAKNELVSLGFKLSQDGLTEGTLLFDPTNDTQALAAIRTCCIGRPSNLEAAQIAHSETQLSFETA